MILVIDGFNLIYKFEELENFMYQNKLEQAMSGLIDYLLIYSEKIKKKPIIHVFFDGKKKPNDFTTQEVLNGIHCYYSLETSADSLIYDFIKYKRIQNQSVKVITSDKQIQIFAKKYKCEYQTSEEFYQTFKEMLKSNTIEPEKPEKISKKEMNFWLEIFKKR